MFMVNLVQASPIQWTTGSGANSHWYEAVTNTMTWDEANTAAQTKTYNGVQGHLVTITSSEENEFVWGLRTDNGGYSGFNSWLGGYQSSDSTATGDGWAWVTGEDWIYTSWAYHEPNDVDKTEDHTEDHIHFYHGNWNDYYNNKKRTGYIVEYENTVPIPGAVWLLGSGLIGMMGIRRRRTGLGS